MQIINFPQGTQEWMDARLGVITASKFADATKSLKSGQPAAAAIDYANQLAYERVMKAPAEIVNPSAAMRRGTELEPAARRWYEAQTGEIVEQTGLILSDCGSFGYSPDGLVGADGLIEIKCPAGKQFAAVLCGEDGPDAADYIDQIEGGLWLSGRQWCDLIIFTDGGGGSGCIIRIWRDEDRINALAIKLSAFHVLVISRTQKLKSQIR